jgi:hypothetical protein
MDCGAVWKSKRPPSPDALKRMIIKKHVPFWVLTNVLGICAYLCIEAWLLMPRSQGDSLNAFDIIHFWLTAECPLLIVFLMLNLIWAICIIKNRHSDADRRKLVMWLGVCVAWTIVIFVYGIGVGMLKVLIIFVDKNLWNRG